MFFFLWESKENIYILNFTETIILVDGCDSERKMAYILSSSGSMIVEIDAAGSGMDEH